MFKKKMSDKFKCKYCIGIYPLNKMHKDYRNTCVECGVQIDKKKSNQM